MQPIGNRTEWRCAGSGSALPREPRNSVAGFVRRTSFVPAKACLRGGGTQKAWQDFLDSCLLGNQRKIVWARVKLTAKPWVLGQRRGVSSREFSPVLCTRTDGGRNSCDGWGGETSCAAWAAPF